MFYETKNFDDFKMYPYPPVEERRVRFEKEITIFENEIYSVSSRNIEIYRNNSWHDKVREFLSKNILSKIWVRVVLFVIRH